MSSTDTTATKAIYQITDGTVLLDKVENNGLDNTAASTTIENNSDNEVVKGPCFGMRHVQALLIFINLTVLFISRLNIGVAVVAMTNAATTNPDFPEFGWKEKEISYVLSSFYWGYTVTQFPGGILCRRFGVKLILGISTFGSMLMSAFSPCSATWGGWQAFCVIRFVQGLFQGLMYPCIHQHLAKWSPAQERSRLGALSYTGSDFGTVVAMALTGYIAAGPLGWPGVSYVSAGMCLVWCVLWLIFGANNATESKFITDDEKLYIEKSLAHGNDFHAKKIPVPWKAIFISLPFNALLVARGASSWGLSTLQTQIPSYLNGVLGMEIKANALFSALPFLAQWLTSYVYVVVADLLQTHKICSLTMVRKCFNTIGFWIPVAGLIGIGFLDKSNTELAIALMTMNVGAISGGIIGSAFNTIDLSPTHAGVLMGIVNSLASLVALISPLVVGAVVTDSSNRSHWQIVFAISAATLFFGNLFYIIFGSTAVQPWDDDNFLENKNSKNHSEDAEHRGEIYTKNVKD